MEAQVGLEALLSAAQGMMPGPLSKDRSRVATVQGRVRQVTKMSSRLHFISLALDQDGDIQVDGAAERQHCVYLIFKDRDGFFSVCEIDGILDALVVGERARVTGYLEMTGEEAIGKLGELNIALHPSEVELITEDWRVKNRWQSHSHYTSYRLSSAVAPLHQMFRSRKSGNRSRPRNANRAAVFASFIMNAFGHRCQLNRGTGIVDIAGGAGALTFELTFRYCIKCTVVDPVQVKHTAKQLKAVERKLRDEDFLVDKETSKAISVGYSCIHGREDDSKSTEILRVFVKQFQIEFYADYILRRFIQAPPIAATDTNALDPLHKAREQVADHVSKCSLLVGLHPDQAIDDIVDVGLALKKPFAVIPCCVFPKRFSKRRLKNGNHVNSYEELCLYLIEKAPSKILQTALDFEGRNKCLYYLGEGDWQSK